MVGKELNAKIDAYIDDVWDQVVADIALLVKIPSFEEPDKAAPGAPYGPGPAEALAAGLALGERLGLKTTNGEGYIGFGDLPGKSPVQFGIIGHLDVVPPGAGWDTDPFEVTRKDGYLVGRGCVDDKGPSVVALYAVKFLAEHYGDALPYTIRFIFGANEETGMADVAYYHKHFDDPVFVVTPDADFPVCYGEKGGFDGLLTSKPLPKDAVILDFQGGSASNAVPGQAQVLVRANAAGLAPTDRIAIEDKDGNALLTATGISGHAARPEGTINAIFLLVDYLLAHGLCTDDERAFLKLQYDLLATYDGSGVGVNTSDEAFGPLTLIGGTVHMTEDRRIAQTIDIRYPTSITHEDIIRIIGGRAQEIGASFENTLLMPPFLAGKDSPFIQDLLAGYNEVTGEDAKPFTIGGGTYAREFTAGASFGPGMPWLKDPAWVGSEHCANEAIREEQLKQALKIYIVAFDKIMQRGVQG